MDRRALLQTLLAAAATAALPAPAAAFGDRSRFVFAQGRHGGSWQPRPNALRRLGFELGTRTSVAALPEARAVDLASPELFSTPFLYVGGDGPMPPLPDAAIENLRRFLTFGGFVVFDAADGARGAFAAAAERELARILPTSPVGRVPATHVLYKSFYLLDQPVGRVLERPYLSGSLVGERLAAVVSANDLAGAWSRDDLGSWDYECVPGGDPQRELAFRLGVNLVMYALCTDYKEDQVHIPFIMKRRR